MEFIGADEAVGTSPQAQQYTFEMEDRRYIYIAVWGSQSATPSVLAEFLFNGVEVYSGDPAWEVYAAGLGPERGDPPPRTSEVGRYIRTANRRHAWRPAALAGANGVGLWGLMADISPAAGWMRLPSGDEHGAAASPAGSECVVFRISPTELWPEIELWHGRNVGSEPTAGGPFAGDARRRYMGGSVGRRGGGGGIPGTGGLARLITIGNPFPDFDPPNSSSIPPGMTPSTPSAPQIPPPNVPDEPPTDDRGRTPPDDVLPPPSPPVIPEPGSVLLLLLGAAWNTGRR